MNKLALIDYGSGNVRSAARALRAAAQMENIDLELELTSDPDLIADADRIVLPGVGHFADCMTNLKARDGVIDAMMQAVFAKSRPFFGVCVGMQLLASLGLEDGETDGLGWIPGIVDRLNPMDSSLPIPHMGWNEVFVRDHPVLDELGENPHVYFTHSFAISCEEEGDIAATCDYGGGFVAAVRRDNIFGVQFHPEKSQKTGLKILANFLRWKP